MQGAGEGHTRVCHLAYSERISVIVKDRTTVRDSEPEWSGNRHKPQHTDRQSLTRVHTRNYNRELIRYCVRSWQVGSKALTRDQTSLLTLRDAKSAYSRWDQQLERPLGEKGLIDCHTTGVSRKVLEVNQHFESNLWSQLRYELSNSEQSTWFGCIPSRVWVVDVSCASSPIIATLATRWRDSLTVLHFIHVILLKLLL